MERRSSPPRSRWRPRTTTVEIIPLFHGDERLGVMVAFIDVTRPHATSNQLEQARRELETAYEEIQSTVEELETTNEELQSTNEELETTNEELQSTNEELETMNEELQSTNQELSTVNTELEERTGQLNQSNSFFESVLESIRAAVIVLAEDLSIETWNSLAEETFGLSAAEVEGKNLLARLRAPSRRVAPGDPRLHERRSGLRRGDARCHKSSWSTDSQQGGLQPDEGRDRGCARRHPLDRGDPRMRLEARRYG